MRWMLIGLVMVAVGCAGQGASTRAGGAAKPAPITTKAAQGAKALLDEGSVREALPAAQAEWAAAKKKSDKTRLVDAALVLGEVQLRLALYKDAAATLDEAAAALDATREDDQLLIARVESLRASLLYVQANWPGGLEHGKKALAIRTKRCKPDDPELAESLGDVGFMLAESDEGAMDNAVVEKARKNLLRSWQIRIKVCGAESAEAGEAWNNLGLFFISHDVGEESFLAGMDGPALAEKCLQKGLEIRRKALSKNHPDIAESLVNLAYFELLQEKDEEAEKYAREALEMLEKLFGRDHPDVAYALNILGQVRAKQDRPIEAEAMFVRAEGIYEKTFGPDHYFVGTVLESLVELYEESGQKEKVPALRKRLDRIKGRDI